MVTLTQLYYSAVRTARAQHGDNSLLHMLMVSHSSRSGSVYQVLYIAGIIPGIVYRNLALVQVVVCIKHGFK